MTGGLSLPARRTLVNAIWRPADVLGRSGAMTWFEEQVVVRFAHVDAAGIVFYPRYFEMVNQVVEDWFAGPLGCDFGSLHGDLKMGVPTVSIECEFARPSRLGDDLAFRLGVLQRSRSSFTLGVIAEHRGEQRMKSRLVLVCADLETMRARPIPEQIRSRMDEFEVRLAGDNGRQF